MGEVGHKKVIVVDYDRDRNPPMIVAYTDPNIKERNPVEDMAILCEAICTLIHAANTMGVKPDYQSVKDCIDHFKKGFMDESYKAGPVEEL